MISIHVYTFIMTSFIFNEWGSGHGAAISLGEIRCKRFPWKTVTHLSVPNNNHSSRQERYPDKYFISSWKCGYSLAASQPRASNDYHVLWRILFFFFLQLISADIFLISHENVGTHKDCFAEVLLTSTYNVFLWRNKKIHLDTLHIWSYEWMLQ